MNPDDMIRLDTVIKRLTFVLNRNNTSGIIKKPLFKDVIFNYLNFEKIESIMNKA